MTDHKLHVALLDKLRSKQATIGIVGLGYVGLPLVLRYLDIGYKVMGLDIDANKIKSTLAGESYIAHIDATLLKEKASTGKYDATTDFTRVNELDAIILCVPTPLNEYREPDLSFIINSVDSIVPSMQEGQMISLESTTYPGTTEEVLRPRLEKRGFTVGTDVFLVYSPEREDPGNPVFSTKSIPKVCGGSTEKCCEVGVALYDQVIDKIVAVSSTQVAEFVKILENTYRAVNIALVNELKILADKMDLDIFEIITAASTKPFGFSAFYPGPGLGGHCLPIDPFYLTWKSREFGQTTRFIELAGEINSYMPDYVISKVTLALNDQAKSVKNSKILVVGIAYKKNVDDMRESPAVALMQKLKDLGADIAYSDPYVPVFPRLRKYYFELKSEALTPENLASFDCVLIVTDHDDLDWKIIEEHSQLIVDTRGIYRHKSEKIYRA